MLRHERSAPIWLFSFVDLAFLLLIAFTQIGPRPDAAELELAGIEIPRIHGRGRALPGSHDAAAWQLRVRPTRPGASEGTDHAPFLLVQTSSVGAVEPVGVVAEELDTQLRVLRERRLGKPVLAPHRDARAEDLLVAVALLEDVWGEDRIVAVRPGPPVAAGPRLRPGGPRSNDLPGIAPERGAD